jgi:Trk-type K+ transport system membrane component
MEKLLILILSAACIVFGISFFIFWEYFANLIINQNVKQYYQHKLKIRILLYSIAIVFLFGGIKLIVVDLKNPQSFIENNFNQKFY